MFNFFLYLILFFLGLLILTSRRAGHARSSFVNAAPALFSPLEVLGVPTPPRAPRRPKKSVRFATLAAYPDVDVTEYREYEVESVKKWPANCRHSCDPQRAGIKNLRQNPDGSISFLRQIGASDFQRRPDCFRPRCQNLIHFKKCEICRRPEVETNRWHLD